MKKINFLVFFFVTLFLLTGCQAVKKKTDAIVEKENEKLSRYIGKSSNELRLDLGKPDEDYKNAKGKSLQNLIKNLEKIEILNLKKGSD